MENNFCDHINSIKEVKLPDEPVCVQCVEMGSKWLHLRTCQTCGITLCCDSSPNKHMTKHYHRTQHPVVASAEVGERWLWCYADELFVEY